MRLPPRGRRRLTYTCLALLVPVTIATAQQPARIAASLVFDGVTVVDVEQGKLLPDQRVVIVGNRIKAVGSAVQVRIPHDAQIVEARGKYLIPGLWDMHTHADHATDLYYPLFIANGVTGIRDAGSSVPLDTLHLLRREILAGTRVGPPRQLLSGQSITNYLQNCDRNYLWAAAQTCVSDSADAVHYVDSLKVAGADMIKPRDVYPPMYFILAAEARRVALPFGGAHLGQYRDYGVRQRGQHHRSHSSLGRGLRCPGGVTVALLGGELARQRKG